MRPVRALPLAAVFALFAIGASCDDGPKQEDDTVESTAAATGAETAPIESIEGVDVSGLSKGDKKRWVTLVNELLSPCGQPVSVARCATEGASCPKCKPAAQYVARLVGEAYERGEIEELYRNRYDDERKAELPVESSPIRGSPMAPVTIVEFSDFECPFCAGAYPVLERVVDESGGKVRMVFKHYPLDSHTNARAAARAAIAAGKQGKFWEMHDALFEHQDALDPSDIEGYASELGLDMKKFREDVDAAETEQRIEKDRSLGRKAGVRGTPSVFVNGRLYEGALQSLPAYIDEELNQ